MNFCEGFEKTAVAAPPLKIQPPKINGVKADVKPAISKMAPPAAPAPLPAPAAPGAAPKAQAAAPAPLAAPAPTPPKPMQAPAMLGGMGQQQNQAPMQVRDQHGRGAPIPPHTPQPPRKTE